MSDNSANVEVKMGSERSFGVVFGLVFLLVGIWPLTGGGSVRIFFVIAGLAFFALGFWAPGVLRVPNKLWFKFGMLLGAVVAPIVMALVFVTTFVPFGLALRLMGKDLLKMKLDPDAPSYWIDRTEAPQSLKNQF